MKFSEKNLHNQVVETWLEVRELVTRFNSAEAEISEAIIKAKKARQKALTVKKWTDRGKLTAQDLTDIAAGRARRKDLAGREKKRFYERERFKSALKNIAIAGAIVAAPRARDLHRVLARRAKRKKTSVGKEYRAAAWKTTKSAAEGVKGVATNPLKRRRAVANLKARANAAGIMAEKRLRRFFNLASREQIFEFVEKNRREWELTPVSKRTAKVHAPGGNRRQRREKHWHEKKDNREKVAMGLILAAALGGVGIGKKVRPQPRRRPAAMKQTKKRRSETSNQKSLNRHDRGRPELTVLPDPKEKKV